MEETNYFDKINSMLKADNHIEDIVSFMENNHHITPKVFTQLFNRSGKDVRNPFGLAAELGRLDVMSALLDKGCGPASPCLFFVPQTKYGNKTVVCQAIHLACYTGQLDVLAWLVENENVDVSTVDERGDNPLMYAITSEICESDTCLEIVKYLVESGLDIHDKNMRRRNIDPLHEAARMRNWRIFVYLISEGMDINEPNDRFETPLSTAVLSDDAESIRLFLALGADINYESMRVRFGMPLMKYAIEQCSLETVRALCSKADPEGVDEDGNAPLHYAVIRDCISDPPCRTVHYFLVELNVWPHRRNNAGNKAFSTAVKRRCQDVLNLFLEAGYTPDTDSPMPDCKAVFPTQREFFDKWKIVLSSPRSLQSICCFRLRSLLGRRLSYSVSGLPLPERLKQFLKLKHINFPLFSRNTRR